ncbi:MAG: ATP-binding domain-containing protein [Saprospiraceae bacterium]
MAFKVAGGATARVLLKWRKIDLAAQDSNGFKPLVDTYMLENYLYSKANTLKPEEQQALYVDFKNRHQHLKPGSIEFKEALRNDPFFNALRLKYGFAVTCHKAQGGEWDSAFVFWDYGRPANFDVWKEKQEKTGRNNADFYRWAYTAITRRSGNLYIASIHLLYALRSFWFFESGRYSGCTTPERGIPSVFTFEAGQEMMDNMLRPGCPATFCGNTQSLSFNFVPMQVGQYRDYSLETKRLRVYLFL